MKRRAVLRTLGEKLLDLGIWQRWLYSSVRR
jgi:hypothetical protein